MNNTTFPTFSSQKALSQAVTRLYELAKDAGLSKRSEAQELLAQVLGAPNYNVLLAATSKNPNQLGNIATSATSATDGLIAKNPQGQALSLNTLASIVHSIPENHTCELLSDVYCIDPTEGSAPNYMAVSIGSELLSELFNIFIEVKQSNLAKSGTLLRVTQAWNGKGVWKESHGSHDLDFVSTLMKENGTDALRALCFDGIEVYARQKAQEEDHNSAQESSIPMERCTLEVAIDGTFRLSGCPRHWDDTGRCYTPWIPLNALKEQFLYVDRRDTRFK